MSQHGGHLRAQVRDGETRTFACASGAAILPKTAAFALRCRRRSTKRPMPMPLLVVLQGVAKNVGTGRPGYGKESCR